VSVLAFVVTAVIDENPWLGAGQGFSSFRFVSGRRTVALLVLVMTTGSHRGGDMFRLAHRDADLRERHMRYRVCALGFVLVLVTAAAPPSHASPRGALARATGGAVFAGPVNPFTGLGHEGSGLLGSRRLAAHATTSSLNPFTGLGHEGSGLLDSRHLAVGGLVAGTNPLTSAEAMHWALGTFHAGHHVWLSMTFRAHYVNDSLSTYERRSVLPIALGSRSWSTRRRH
jgi:hypothetical protein